MRKRKQAVHWVRQTAVVAALCVAGAVALVMLAVVLAR